MRSVVCALNGVMEVVGINDIQAEAIEMFMQFLVVQAHENKRVAFLFYQFVNLRIVIAFIFAAEDKHGWCGHRFKSIPARVDVGGFGVIYPPYTANGRYVL